jgi:hypothetical protein
MHKLLSTNRLLLLFGVVACVLLLASSLAAARAESAFPSSLNATSTAETWSLGVTVEGPPTYSAIIGRLVSDVAAFRSFRATEAATIFPAPATARTVQSASFYLLSRTGTYSGAANLSLVIYDYAGTIQHTVGAPINLQTQSVGVWTPFAISTVPDDLVISPGEFLAFRFTLSGITSGNLDARPLFEVSVQ